MLVDSHCHLNFPEFKEDLPAVLHRAKLNGIATMLTINTRLTEAREIQAIAEGYSNIFCTVGVHPHDAQDYASTDLKHQLLELAQHPKVVGLGETGLDYYYNNSPMSEQIESFEIHLDASKDLDLPVVVHTRNADADTLACMDRYRGTQGVFHCFSGGLDMAKAGLARGYLISFSGIITFKKAEELREVVKYVPLDKILVETDAPFLAPIPHRGKRNEPAFTLHTAEMVAELKGISLKEVAVQTTDNFFNLFKRARRPS
ncbi:TatD family hydrolase [Candidatus Odyssella acanthamoebae]|uniref:LuxR family transcriptional regulator n=1 Tax=Candidatus Odyssella acanthamoebae TaxID=91604 RepID=A0A077AVQ8_9PROT|nr:TatD family hydrolase [Candidatus Paracaedibacter acanthamoebae]AIK95748.1 LuxR family transcriptional regulator [Candidatus Paracaedibacter acanthamoebae]